MYAPNNTMWKWMGPALLWYLNKMSESPSVMSSSFRHHGLYSPWASPGQTSGVGNLPFSRASSQLRGWAQVSRMAGEFFTVWASWRRILYCLSLLKADSLLSEPPEGGFFTSRATRKPNPRNGGAWWAAIDGIAQSRTWLKWLSTSSSNKLLELF